MKSLEKGVSCSEAAISPKYISYLLESVYGDESLPMFLEQIGGSYCVIPLGYNESIVYFENPNADGSFRGDSPYIGYNEVPKCYGLMAEDILDSTGVRKLRRYPNLGFRGSGTLIGLVDTGIDLHNPLFLYEDGTTKVAALWDQSDIEAREPANAYENPNIFSPFFGREWSREEINTALQEKKALPTDENGHGTFLASVASGRELQGENGFSGIAPDAELLVVKLKQAKENLRDFYSIPPGTWACQEDDVLLAIRYLVDKSMELRRPISICIGIGSNLGGHEGNDTLSRYISSHNLITGVAFQIASGNEGIAAHHYMGNIPLGEDYRSVDFNVAEGENGFIMELWGTEATSFSVGFLSPGGEDIPQVRLSRGEFRNISFFPEDTVIGIRSFPGATVTGQQVIRMNFRNPTSGIWKLFVYGTGDGERAFHIWLPISNFLKEETRFLNATSNVTLTSPGNARYGITYTPYDTKTNSLYVRASRGFTANNTIKPDLAAPGVSITVPAANGRNDTRSGSSIAAACGTGISALWLEWGIVRGNDPSMSGQNIRYLLIQGAMRMLPYRYPNEEWGYGAVNVYDSFFSLRG